MPSKRISFSNFNRRIALAGGREQGPPGGLRRASGVAPEQTNSVLSRWGSQLLYSGINAHQLYYWNGARYAYDGTQLWRNGVAIVAGFNGATLSFNSMPPQPGLPDYLFILGGGVTPFKIDQSGNITNWGIVAPVNAATASNLVNDQIVIDNFNASSASWTPTNCTRANEATIVRIGSGSLSIDPTGNAANPIPWHIQHDFGSAQNWGTYASNNISLQTDIFQIWVYVSNLGVNQPGTALEFDVDINDGSFKKDWYSFVVGLLNPSSASPHVRRHTQLDVTFVHGQWQQITWAKSQFVRNGTNLQLDWSMVQSIRIKGGALLAATPDPQFYLDNFTLSGGSAMGAGPAAAGNGSEYDYYTVYRNLTTGSQSNPNDSPIKLFDVKVNQVQLRNIPISSDPQVSARDLYRTQALNVPGGGVAFYLDTIYDNSTTTYADKTADQSFRLATTPWTASIVVPPATPPTLVSAAAYYIDAGNGYYFKLTTPGTTGGTPPVWVIPTSQWSRHQAFVLNETVAPLKAAGVFWIVTTEGTSGIIEPNWAASPGLGSTIVDGTITWTNQGTKTTVDNSAVWTFQGINSTPVLSNDALLFDNAPPKITYGDAVGPHQASMFWCRDSAAGARGYVYASPPGRPESVGQVYQVSSNEDPTQKLVIWDQYIWLLTSGRGFQGVGSYPAVAFQNVDGIIGTLAPDTVVSLQVGIIYWAADGLRMANFLGSRLVGFESVSTILRGQAEENISAPWSATTPPRFAANSRDEYLISDRTNLTLAIVYDGATEALAWRQPGQIMTAFYFERQTGFLQACFGGNIYLFEQPGQLTDGDAAIPFEMQSMGDLPDAGAQFTTQRIYITANLNGQTVTPTLIVDGTGHVLPQITNTARGTIELTPKIPGLLFDGVDLVGSLTNRIEVFRIEGDVWLGEQQQSGG